MRALGRRLRPAPPGAVPMVLPPDGEIWEDEDGDFMWAQGHVEPYRMVLAAAVVHGEHCGPIELLTLLFGDGVVPARGGQSWPSWTSEAVAARRARLNDLVMSVEHLWFHPHPADDERFVLCTASHDLAQPITRLSL